MLKIFDAIQFQKVFTEGGRTKPWLIQVTVDGERTPYVVKLFRANEVDIENTVAREVFGTVLAKEFDLSVPEIALIRFGKPFVDTLPKNVWKQLHSSDDRLKFGSVYKPNTQLLLPNLSFGKFAKVDEDAASIYAFDTLIDNKDRGKYKTNILLSNTTDEYFIIDHERAFKQIAKLAQAIRKEQFPEVFKGHVFYEHLCQSKSSDLFSTFQENLRNLNADVLQPYQNILQRNGLGYSDFQELKSYLYTLKKRSAVVEKMLYKSLLE